MFVRCCYSIKTQLHISEWRHSITQILAMESSSTFGTPSILSIQELAKQPISSLPKIFLWEDQELPVQSENPSLPEHIPIIDMKCLITSETADFELGKLQSACKEWGFFQVLACNLFILMIYSLMGLHLQF